MERKWTLGSSGAFSLLPLYWGMVLLRKDRTGIAAGSPIPIELMKRLIDTLNLRELTNAYGMSECFPQFPPCSFLTPR